MAELGLIGGAKGRAGGLRRNGGARTLKRLARRFATSIVTLLAITLLVFVVLRTLPADPVAMLMPGNATEADMERVRALLGLDRSVLAQYAIWLGDALKGDFGRSIQHNTPVRVLIADALPVTLQIVTLSVGLGIFLGFSGGLLAFTWRGTPVEAGIEMGNGLAMAVPDFLWGIILILAVGVGLQWLPFIGLQSPSVTVPDITGFVLIDALLAGDPSAFLDVLRHLALPVFAIAMGLAPTVMRVFRSGLMEAYTEDYIASARLRGQSERQVLLRHGLKNAVIPTITLIGVQASMLFGGTLLIETIFGLPGIGAMMVTAIGGHDLPAIQALTFCYAVLVLATTIAVDVICLALDPRLRIKDQS
ncbi:ABC transporter permease [Thalassovita mangrovi]|uniref:ABC transporter permease subunit n=1 Tax=Thalassovita mangrovi TaxID=2692236 RepID=A0A6L8LJS2_9RHOB|nr:ABC transporter permease [Thalassovita mangrovi]MYM56347.1 ABC transporter permease subunit [Thalassovita mangrovi]